MTYDDDDDVVQDSLISSQTRLTGDGGRKTLRGPSCDPDSLARLNGNQLNKCSSLSQYSTAPPRLTASLRSARVHLEIKAWDGLRLSLNKK